MAGYIRQDTTGAISNNSIIEADDLNSEFDAVEGAFNAITGHTHDGTSAEGAPIEVVGPAQDVVITASTIRPKTDNAVDLGTSTLEFKDLYLDGTANIDNLVADAGTVGGSAITTAANTQTLTNKTLTSPILNTPDINTPDIDGGTIDGTTIGGAAAAAGTFTTLIATGNTTLGGAATDTVTITADVASNIIPSADNTYDLGASGSEWKDLYVDGTANIDSLVADTADINGGTIDGTVIGGSTPAAISGTTITGTSFVTTGDMTFGDNDKAIFGAGSDLQIYHDGDNSIIKDAGTGNIVIGADAFTYIGNPAGTTTAARFNATGAQLFYYDNNSKLSTTATGIDVTGTVTADGLTVEQSGNDVSIVSRNTSNNASVATSSSLKLGITSTVGTHDSEIKVVESAGNSNTTRMEFYNYFSGTLYRNMSILGNGDISFYDSAGSSQAFFWDASAESLGIGTSSPGQKLVVDGNIQLGTSSGAGKLYLSSATGFSPRLEEASNALAIYTNNTERMCITSAGNVGVGESNPAATFHANSGLANLVGLFESTDAGATITLIDNSTTGGSVAEHGLNTVGDQLEIRAVDNLSFETSGSEGMRIDSSGHAIIPGGVTLGTAAGVYNAANTLDDYEEGEFGVTITPKTSGTITLNSAFNNLAYTKIGRVVTVTGMVIVSSVASPVGTDFTVDGLPFAIADLGEAAGRFGGAISFFDGSTTTAEPFRGFEAGTTITVAKDASTVGASDQLYIQFTYFTS